MCFPFFKNHSDHCFKYPPSVVSVAATTDKSIKNSFCCTSRENAFVVCPVWSTRLTTASGEGLLQKTSLTEPSPSALTVSLHVKMERSGWAGSSDACPLKCFFLFPLSPGLLQAWPVSLSLCSLPAHSLASQAEAENLRQAVARVLTLLWRNAPGQGLLRGSVALCRQAALPAQVGSPARGDGGSEQTLACERRAGRAGGREIYGLCTLSGSRAQRQNHGAPRARGRELGPQSPRPCMVPTSLCFLQLSGQKLPRRARLKTKVQQEEDEPRKRTTFYWRFGIARHGHRVGLQAQRRAAWPQVRTGHGTRVSPPRRFLLESRLGLNSVLGPWGPDVIPFVALAHGR